MNKAVYRRQPNKKTKQSLSQQQREMVVAAKEAGLYIDKKSKRRLH
jgi:hypothetical protein